MGLISTRCIIFIVIIIYGSIQQKNDYFMSYRRIFSHISKMTLTFKTNFNNITYEYFLEQTKSMLEWRIFEKLARNPRFIEAFVRTLSNPLIGEYSNVDTVENKDLI